MSTASDDGSSTGHEAPPLTRFHQRASHPPRFHDLCRLEFYQVFPHDPAATLCLRHFLWLARSWFARRRGDPARELAELALEYPHNRVDGWTSGVANPDSAWRQTTVDDLVEEVRVEVLTAEQRLRILRRNAARLHRGPPGCCLRHPLVCGFCAAVQHPQAVDICDVIEVAEARPPAGPRLDPAHSFAAVGGLGFLVDVCDDAVMIKFASTKVSLPEQQQLWLASNHANDAIFDAPTALELVPCTAGDRRCVCQAGLGLSRADEQQTSMHSHLPESPSLTQ